MFQTANLRIFFGIKAHVEKKITVAISTVNSAKYWTFCHVHLLHKYKNDISKTQRIYSLYSKYRLWILNSGF